MPTTSAMLTGLAGVLAILGLAVYLFGIPPEMKHQISKIPASDQKEVKELKNNLGDVGGGVMQNPIGEEGGELADKLTSPFTGR
ncbi:hypothetical protein E6O75_ATG11547 [Venturia nashicola]|uniref:Uncharacterized protein n=1 Tax=Venturia nashicola TaxID=86259 RepID=A0A4Z1NY33_9PEZI|nr:hypothetical protein E6O75_ATG11547 [Venturia nashicola]